jgi:hypothetical protein
LATPLLYVGIPVIVGGCIFLAVLRFALGLCGYVRPSKSNYKLAATAIVLAGLAFMFQKPERVDACDADSRLVYKLTHSYWHILIAIASFLNHRFCFFERLQRPEEGDKARMNEPASEFEMNRADVEVRRSENRRKAWRRAGAKRQKHIVYLSLRQEPSARR